MKTNIIESVLIGFFILTLFSGVVEVGYNYIQKKTTAPYVWIVPSIVFAVFWFVHNS